MEDMEISKFYHWYYYGGKIPRKIKKKVLDQKMSESKLNRLIKSIKLGPPIRTMFERREIFPFAFCPNCGETKCVGTGNKTTYPEHWEYFHCLRCRKVVAMIDNSPHIHILEYGGSWDLF